MFVSLILDSWFDLDKTSIRSVGSYEYSSHLVVFKSLKLEVFHNIDESQLEHKLSHIPSDAVSFTETEWHVASWLGLFLVFLWVDESIELKFQGIMIEFRVMVEVADWRIDSRPLGDSVLSEFQILGH